jgi:hypothetical protein
MLNTSYESCIYLYRVFVMQKCTFTGSDCLQDACPILKTNEYVNKHTEILHNLATEMEKSMQGVLALVDVVKEINSDIGKLIDELDKKDR